MKEVEIFDVVAGELGLELEQIQNTAKLLDAGNTMPYITYYCKEATGSLDEGQIRAISERLCFLRALRERKKNVRDSIKEQGKLTPELAKRIDAATGLRDLDSLYLTYRPNRRTRATIARERGLKPLADEILSQAVVEGALDDLCAAYVAPDQGLDTVYKVLQGAREIVAEVVAEDPAVRRLAKERTVQHGILHSAARDPAQYSQYQAYYRYSEQVKQISSHRVLAINRGEREGLLKVHIEVPVDDMLSRIERLYIKRPSSVFFYQMKDAIRDAYKRLIAPCTERDVRAELTETAEGRVVHAFSENLRRLLLMAPAKGKRVMGIDPGYVSGSRLAVVDETGKYLGGDTIYPHAPHKRTRHAKKIIKALMQKHQVDVLAVGNGSASRETELLLAGVIPELDRKVVYTIVSEAGATMYATSKIGESEFPNLDPGMRATISLARRLLDPLAEWVKIDPRSIAVGFYQHDVPPKRMADALETVIESCVNYVGVDLNTASVPLLKYVSGISGQAARNITRFRNKNGRFTSRAQLLEVNGIDKHAYQQAAGFMRATGGENPLDNTPIHPQSYRAAKALLKSLKLDLGSIAGEPPLPIRLLLKNVDLDELAGQLGIGSATLKDILSVLEKPHRDPRDDMPKPLFRSDVLKMGDLREGMRLRGTVRNVVDFGAFVDIGIKDDALVHISEMSRGFVKSPFDVVSVGDDVEVKVLSVDQRRRRVALSMRL